VERSRDFGGPWLGLQLLRRLELIDFLEEIMPCTRAEIPWPRMAAVLVLCRWCRPSSELYIVEHLYKHTAIADLLGIPSRKINEQRLYRALDKVLAHREALQIFLKNRRRCVTRPDEHQAILLHRLGLNLPSNLPVTDEKLGRM